MRNLKLTIRYDGTDFNGWQTQPGTAPCRRRSKRPSPRSRGASACGSTPAAGPTPASTRSGRSPTSTPRRSCRCDDAAEGDQREAAGRRERAGTGRGAAERSTPTRTPCGRCTATSSTTAGVQDPFLRKYAWFVRQRSTPRRWPGVAGACVGRHDFHCFETEWPNRLTSVRTITHLAVNRFGEYIWIDVEADGFLYNMVRAIAGTLVNVGRGFWPEIAGRRRAGREDRRLAGPTAPPEGLFLMRVTYPEPLARRASAERGAYPRSLRRLARLTDATHVRLHLPAELEIAPLAKPPSATVTVPGSKSITNRALVLAALCEHGTGLYARRRPAERRHGGDDRLPARLGFGFRCRLDREFGTVTVESRDRRRSRAAIPNAAGRPVRRQLRDDDAVPRRRMRRSGQGPLPARRRPADARAADPGPARRAAATRRRGPQRVRQRLPAGHRRRAAACTAGTSGSGATSAASSSAAC